MRNRCGHTERRAHYVSGLKEVENSLARLHPSRAPHGPHVHLSLTARMMTHTARSALRHQLRRVNLTINSLLWLISLFRWS